LDLPVTNASPTATAVFQPLSTGQFALTVISDGFGTVTNNPRGNRFNNGQVVSLTAVPKPGQKFLGWTGDATGAQNPIAVLMNSSRVITANFTQRPRLDLLTCAGAPNGEEIQLLLRGEFGRSYVIEAATFLGPAADWTQVGVLTASFGAAQFSQPFATNRTQLFFRATTAP
jgi:hypothetical protein